MWNFFQWAWNLSWGDGIALLICLFVFYYGKKWIDSRFGSLNKRQKREMKQVVVEALREWESEVEYLGRPGYKWENNQWVKDENIKL